MRSLFSILLALVLALPLARHGHVLCIGEDGHISVESAVNGKCCDTAAPVGEASLSSISPGNCGVCTDIPIGSAADISRAARVLSAQSTELAPAFAMAARIPLHLCSPALRPPQCRQPLQNPLSHLRTVLLTV